MGILGMDYWLSDSNVNPTVIIFFKNIFIIYSVFSTSNIIEGGDIILIVNYFY